tara:strand:+ start:662 stop:862 length:201 start_codon:yes stop_codon:yes gene_type:complete
MDDKARDQIRRLFAEATMVLENAHEVAVSGQSSKIKARSVERKTDALIAATQKLEMLMTKIKHLAA